MPPRRRRRFGERENLERWLLTYADLITLLLAFFVVMYSMSQVDAKRFGKIAQELNGVLKGGDIVIKRGGKKLQDGHGLLKLGSLKMIRRNVEEKFRNLGKREEIQTEITERGLVVHIMESALFAEGSAQLKEKAIKVLDLLAEQVKDIPNHIRVEGHTDDRIIKTDKYPSNWELSSARATEVVRFLTTNYKISPDRASALGYGEFRPIRENNSVENRAANRRVDIVILTMELTLKEPTSQLYWLNKGEQNIPAQPETASR